MHHRCLPGPVRQTDMHIISDQITNNNKFLHYVCQNLKSEEASYRRIFADVIVYILTH